MGIYGDGDRCFTLIADPSRQGIHVLSGDALMLLISSKSESKASVTNDYSIYLQYH